MIDGDGHLTFSLDVSGSPVSLVDHLSNVPGLGLVDGLGIRDLHGNLDLVGLGDLVDHDIPLAGNLSASTAAVGDAASAVSLTLAVAVRAAAVLGLARRYRVEGNFNGIHLHVLSDFSVAGALLSSPLGSGLVDDFLERTSNSLGLLNLSGGLLHDFLVGGLVLLLVRCLVLIPDRVAYTFLCEASSVCGASAAASGAALATAPAGAAGTSGSQVSARTCIGGGNHVDTILSEGSSDQKNRTESLYRDKRGLNHVTEEYDG